jgi:hypothetical protein
MIYLLFPSSGIYSLNLHGNQTYQAGSLHMVVGNNGINSSKVLSIYRVNDVDPPTEVFTSLLATQTGKVIDNLTFSNEQIYRIRNNDFPIIIGDVEPGETLHSGIYAGFLYVNNGSLKSVPITLFTEPKVFQAVILVVIGVLSSILFWEVFFVLQEIALNEGSGALLSKIRGLALQPPLGMNIQSWSMKIDQFLGRLNHQRTKALEVENRYILKGSQIVGADVGTIAFGIFTGLVGLANNSYITNLIEIDWLDGAILFGIGLGIGSLKGLVDH